MNDKPVKVHLCEAEGARWALDQDYDLTRRALQKIENQIELVPMADAEVIHTVWDEALDRMELGDRAGRYVICHTCTNLFKMLEAAASIRRREAVDRWVVQTGEAAQAASQILWPHTYVPYALDEKLFAAEQPGTPDRRASRRALGLDDREFVIGNFMRDSLGADLAQPKPEKGADLFLEIVCGLKAKGIPVHVLLAGPRRHWLRSRLAEERVPFSFVGEVTRGDDVHVNILPLEKIASLYALLDLCLITSRHEGGPRAVLEAAASRTPVLSTPVGLSIDVLHPSCLYRAVDEGIEKACDIAVQGCRADTLEGQRQTVLNRHTVEAVAQQFSMLYKEILPLRPRPVSLASNLVRRPGTQPKRSHLLRWGWSRLARRPLPGLGIRICLWHEFHKPPYGGGNQFMMALSKGLSALGAEVVNNRLDDDVDVHICNAVWFDPALIEKMNTDRRCRIIHRLDGLVHLARGTPDRSLDDRAYDFNRRFASATVLQSAWCLKQALALGYQPVFPVIIHNACDPAVFFPAPHPHAGQRIRLIATSWSDNPFKGTGLYKFLEQQLDWTQFDFTFVGRTQETFNHIRHVQPMGSRKLADALRQHDIYLTASRNEACSNALIEALACGLPSLYMNDGGNPEVVGLGGLPFDGEEDMLPQLLRLVRFRESFRRCICIGTLQDVAMRYLELAKQVMQI